MTEQLKLALTLEPADHFERIGPRWKKGCPDSRVMFATDGRGLVSIIDHVGPDAAYILEDSINQKMLERDDLAHHPFPGIWVWEGRVHSWRDYWGEYDERFEGTVRPLNDDERTAMEVDGEPWPDRSAWQEEEPGT